MNAAEHYREAQRLLAGVAGLAATVAMSQRTPPAIAAQWIEVTS